jgi:hypothetical protein
MSKPTNAQTPADADAVIGKAKVLVGKVATEGVVFGWIFGTFLAGLLAIVAGGIIWYGMMRNAYVEVRSQVAQAKIIKVEQSDAVYKSATYEFSVGSKTYQKAMMMQSPILDGTIEIEYDPANPNDNALNAHPKTEARNLFIAGAVVFFFAIALFAFSQSSFGSAAIAWWTITS